VQNGNGKIEANGLQVKPTDKKIAKIQFGMLIA
jgi:hypothetical protein